MRGYDHPAQRSTRYHWAAGLNPRHWALALAGWVATFAAGTAGALGNPAAGALTPWLAAATLAYSGFWLIVVPNSPRFKRLTDAELRERYEGDYEYQLAVLSPRVSSDYQNEVENNTQLRDRAREILSSKFDKYDSFAKDNLAKLDKLAISYLQLLSALSEYGEYLSLVDPDSIGRDLDAAQHAAPTDDDALRKAREKQVALLENRLARYRKAQARMALIQAECRNVETTMKLLVDQAMTAIDSQRVGRDIDQVLENIKSSEILSAELAGYGELERELDELVPDKRKRQRQA